MHQSIPKGGLKLIHFQTQVVALKLNWVKRLFNDRNAKWKLVLQQFIPDIEIKDLFLSRCHIHMYSLKKLPLFYIEEGL